ncbi:unnamed protein product [Brassicogethes aeneus]|uniref:Sedoheptulokinase n=1 Tax=Brassicogethes aeneus TaxID=1431903 RepID=A0A9P0B3Z6_BRAAE|nr:unnamed protein product [Brassicogethes aeneus]
MVSSRALYDILDQILNYSNYDMEQYVLGIDIGTTSVKTNIVNTTNNTVEARYIKETQSNIPNDITPGANIQDVPKIVSALNFCVSKLPKHLLSQISAIGLCNQMHGVVCWGNSIMQRSWAMIEKDKDKNFRFDVVPDNVSSLFTWQDNRCDPDFLSSLPLPNSHINLASGYGIPTLCWFLKNKPEFLKPYNCAGTIGDFVVAMLCNLDSPVMSDQNAASWGYYDCALSDWNTELLEVMGFPLKFLPSVEPAGACAGYLIENWHSIPAGTPIGVALGDIQCSVLSSIEHQKDAILNISTSAQICYVASKFSPTSGPPKFGPLEYYPYFNGQYVAVAASLNGGNSLTSFVKMLQQWALELGYSVPQSKVWDKVLSLGNDESAQSNLEIRPTCLGERYDPTIRGSINNISQDNLRLGQVFSALCKGMVENLHDMMPSSLLYEAKITRILGNGKGLLRNPILQKHIEEIYQLPLVIVPGGEAATGAAMAMTTTSNSTTNMSRRSVMSHSIQ